MHQCYVFVLLVETLYKHLLKNLADMSSRNVYECSHEQKAVVWLRVVYPLLFDRNQCCFLLNKSKKEMSFTSLA